MKRTVSTIKQYDYSSKKEFEKHKKEMKERGYHFIEGLFDGWLDASEIQDNKWKFTASYIKSPFY